MDVTNWPEARIELTEAFRQSKGAAVEGRPVVYIVGIDDLLGRSGPVPAMVAAGLASAARTLALELKKPGVPVNTIIVGPDSDPGTVAAWSLMLLQAGPSGPTGELIHLGGTQIGKALS
jgi:NAD(P)-dependent dehydrogenase (short-subunit alcohol dehydrogenase family)